MLDDKLYVQGKELEVILTEKDKKECYSKSKKFVFSVVLKQGLWYWWWSSGSKKTVPLSVIRSLNS
ncbi:hypothetical protein [Paenibacillus pseudetheri]|uniref:Uncharacterized protein n=1 Tax=Paenibacillus pseudetheri TaxID=2897682 RepID=A0ABM9B938_9BACL|nr:hypothetical protein [Paenibacillus pseudetheri]CAH1054899.1 hypothetical protein PAECIP111894_01049 [Paenibacillus pseudetheri]